MVYFWRKAVYFHRLVRRLPVAAAAVDDEY
jgi:hypothetical protein